MPRTCAACGTVNPEGMKFCGECATPFARLCLACGTPGSMRFCGECGTPIEGAAAASAPPAAPPSGSGPVSERRTTTVLFGDLVAFTTYSEGRDPEEVRELLSAYFAVARTVVGRYGGTIEKFIGDAVMAVWGVPVSHEDDAERAVRAGLDLVTEVAALGESAGAPGLSMRVGIVTGSVAVTLGATQEGMVAGDAVNTAARVQTAAAPGSVWVDGETRGLTQAAVAFSDMGEHALKGKAEPVRLFRADTVVAAVGGAQRVDGLEAPLVGRDAELRAVKEALHATQADGRARVVAVTGVAGVGKSRLGWEFEKYVDGITDGVKWHRGRCLSYGEGVAFWAFAEMVRSRLRILEGDRRSEVEGKVRGGVAAFARDEAEAAWLLPRVSALVSGGERTTTFERSDLFAAWTTFLERVSGGMPVALLLEDAQHADDALLDLVDHLVKTIRCPLLVLVLTRPELVERHPALLAGRGAVAVDLAPLPDEAMGALLDGLVDDLPRRARAALVARAEGVPLYAVETVRSLIDQDAVLAREGRYVFVDHAHTIVDLDRLTAPTSLQTLVAARLDTLTAVERRAVQDASVLGLTFRYASLLTLSQVSSYQLDEALAALVVKGLLETQDDPRSPEAGQYRFQQALVREVAYRTLARADRRARHLAAAAQLEQEETDEVAGIIAQHLLDALAASPEHDSERASMTERARALLVTVADRTEALGSPGEALAAASTALDLGPEPGERVSLLERAARVAVAAGCNELGETLAAEAEKGYEAAEDWAGVARALSVLTNALGNLGRTQEADGLARRVADLAAQGREVAPTDLIEAHLQLCWSARARGDRDEEHRQAVLATTLAEASQDPHMLVRTLTLLASPCPTWGSAPRSARSSSGASSWPVRAGCCASWPTRCPTWFSPVYPDDLETARDVVDEALVLRRQLGDVNGIVSTLGNGVIVWWLSGEWDRVVEEADQWLDGEPTATSSELWLARALVASARGEEVTVPELPPSDESYLEQAAGLAAAVALARGGDPAAAARLAEECGRRTVGTLGGDDFEYLCAPGIELQLAAGDPGAAQELLDLTLPDLRLGRPLTGAVVHRLRGLIAMASDEDPETDLRAAEAGFAAYGAPYLLARTRLELGRWLREQGRGDEAAPLLAQARDAFVELRAAPSVAEVDAAAPLLAQARVGIDA